MTITVDQYEGGICLMRTGTGNFCGQQTRRTIRVITSLGHRVVQYASEMCPNCGGERVIWASRYAQGKAIPVETINRFK